MGGLDRQNASLNYAMGGGVGRRIEDPAVRNKRFVLLSWNNCEPRLWAMLALGDLLE